MKERIAALRHEHEGQYGNISCVRTNAQKYLVHYIRKAQLTKLFFLFPVGLLLVTCLPTTVQARLSWLNLLQGCFWIGDGWLAGLAVSLK